MNEAMMQSAKEEKETKRYIGTKIIDATPMTKGEAFDAKILREHTIKGEEEYLEGRCVKYSNGYQSWCPKTIFDENYRAINALNFGIANEMLKKHPCTQYPNARIRRKNWKPETYVGLQLPDEHSKNTGIYFFKESIVHHGHRLARDPWFVDGMDAYADDWEFIEDVIKLGG